MASSVDWMERAFPPENKGKLHRSLDVPEGKTIPKKKMYRAAQSGSPTVKREAQAAINANPRKRYGK